MMELKLSVLDASSCQNVLAAFEFGKALDGFPDLLLGEAQLVEVLQIQPEFRAGAEEMGQAESGIASDGALFVQNTGDAVGWYVKLTRQFSGAHTDFFQFFGQMLP